MRDNHVRGGEIRIRRRFKKNRRRIYKHTSTITDIVLAASNVYTMEAFPKHSLGDVRRVGRVGRVGRVRRRGVDVDRHVRVTPENNATEDKTGRNAKGPGIRMMTSLRTEAEG